MRRYTALSGPRALSGHWGRRPLLSGCHVPRARRMSGGLLGSQLGGVSRPGVCSTELRGMAISGAKYAISVVVNVLARIPLLSTPARDVCVSNLRGGDGKHMARNCTRISITGINDAEITEGMADFRRYLRKRP